MWKMKEYVHALIQTPFNSMRVASDQWDDSFLTISSDYIFSVNFKKHFAYKGSSTQQRKTTNNMVLVPVLLLKLSNS
jgi:hypothetical protein